MPHTRFLCRRNFSVENFGPYHDAQQKKKKIFFKCLKLKLGLDPGGETESCVVPRQRGPGLPQFLNQPISYFLQTYTIHFCPPSLTRSYLIMLSTLPLEVNSHQSWTREIVEMAIPLKPYQTPYTLWHHSITHSPKAINTATAVNLIEFNLIPLKSDTFSVWDFYRLAQLYIFITFPPSQLIPPGSFPMSIQSIYVWHHSSNWNLYIW